MHQSTGRIICVIKDLGGDQVEKKSEGVRDDERRVHSNSSPQSIWDQFHGRKLFPGPGRRDGLGMIQVR